MVTIQRRRSGHPAAGGEDVMEPLLAMLPERLGWRGYFVLRAVHAHAASPVLGRVLANLDFVWAQSPERDWLGEFVEWRSDAGEAPTLASALPALDALPIERRAVLDTLIDTLADVLPEPIRREYDQWKRDRTNLELLRSLGYVHDETDDDEARGIVEHPALRQAVDALVTGLCRDRPRAAVVEGEAGVGKTAVLMTLARELREQGWIVFRCSAGELMAGQAFMGQVEERVQRLVREVEHRRVLWIVPEFHELLYTGRHTHSPIGLLDHLFPHLERGSVRLVGETSPAAFDKVLQQRPRLRGVVETVRVQPLSPEATRDLAGDWARRTNVAEPVLVEAQQLASHFARRRVHRSGCARGARGGGTHAAGRS